MLTTIFIPQCAGIRPRAKPYLHHPKGVARGRFGAGLTGSLSSGFFIYMAETRFKEGEFIWFINNAKVCCGTICGIHTKPLNGSPIPGQTITYYLVGDGLILVNRAYGSRDEFFKSLQQQTPINYDKPEEGPF